METNLDLMDYSMSHYGKSRKDHLTFVKNIFQSIEHPYSSTANWCGIYMGFVANHCGYCTPSKPQVAREWLKTGSIVHHPEQGDIVIFWRGSKTSWMGHVGIFVNGLGGGIICVLGGNQAGNRSVCVSKYSTDRVLGYRRLTKKKPVEITEQSR